MKQEEKKIIIWLVVIIVAIVLVAAGYFLIKNRNNLFKQPAPVSAEFSIYGPIDYAKYEKIGLKKEKVDILFGKMKETTEALKIKPNDYDYLIQLGGFEKILKEYDAALKTYSQAISAFPDYGVAYAETADIYIYPLGRYNEAEDYLKKAIERMPYRSDYYRWLADLYIAKFPQKKAEIEPLMLRGAKETPSNALSFYSYLVVYFQREGDFNKAITYTNKCVQIAPEAERANFRQTLGELQAELKK
ncbi:MAG: hypothetical protein WC518_01170 [Patescibacteria group bacterium]